MGTGQSRCEGLSLGLNSAAIAGIGWATSCVRAEPITRMPAVTMSVVKKMNGCGSDERNDCRAEE
jgi:hypothetical protein